MGLYTNFSDSLPLEMIFTYQNPTQISFFIKLYIALLGGVNQFPLYFQNTCIIALYEKFSDNPCIIILSITFVFCFYHTLESSLKVGTPMPGDINEE